jgi:serine/threonine-protein kinase
VRALDGSRRVHEVRHDRLPGRFVLKLLDDVDARAFQRAVQEGAALHHPGIVRVVDHGTSFGGGAFVVLEWADGRSLASMLASGGPLSPEAVARVVASAALGLQAAHRQGVVHGHLSPEHILVSGAGPASDDETPGAEHTKLLGFGLGPAALGRNVGRNAVTPYTAPELATRHASPLADQFSLAAIAYELLAGQPPAGDAARRRPPRSLREYDPTINVVIDDVVQRGLSFDPTARWPDVHTFAARLREAVDSEGTLEEKTRLAPLPLTVTKPTGTPTPTPIELGPVIASIDVDLRTPAPKRALPFRELPQPSLPVQGDLSMNPPPSRREPFKPNLPNLPNLPSLPNQMAPRQTTMPGQFPPRAPTAPHYGIRPTPTFSFSDELEGELHRRRRRRSGGGFSLLLVVLAAGIGGYLAVQTHVWQHAEPLVARAKELAHSLRTLAPGASPEPAAPPQSASAVAATPGASTAAAVAPAPAAPSAMAVVPEVVPIAPSSPSRSAASAGAAHASRRTHARAEHVGHAEHVGRTEHASRTRTTRALSDEAATEEALLAPP